MVVNREIMIEKFKKTERRHGVSSQWTLRDYLDYLDEKRWSKEFGEQSRSGKERYDCDVNARTV